MHAIVPAPAGMHQPPDVCCADTGPGGSSATAPCECADVSGASGEKGHLVFAMPPVASDSRMLDERDMLPSPTTSYERLRGFLERRACPVHSDERAGGRKKVRLRGATVMSKRVRYLALHVTALIILVVADVLFFVHHCANAACLGSEAQAARRLGAMLIPLYLSIAASLPAVAWAAGRKPGRAQVEEASARGVLCGLGPCAWFLVAALHVAVAFTSSWWREAVAGPAEAGVPAIRATCVSGVLQLLLLVLYSGSLTLVLLLNLMAGMVLLVVEALCGYAPIAIFDHSLIFSSMAIVCILAARRDAPIGSRQAAGVNDAGYSEWLSPEEQLVRLDAVFRPICGGGSIQFEDPSSAVKVSTHLEKLVKRLHLTKENIHRELEDSELGKLFSQVFSFLLSELGLLDRLSLDDFDAASPMTRDFLNRTLAQGPELTVGVSYPVSTYSDASDAEESARRDSDPGGEGVVACPPIGADSNLGADLGSRGFRKSVTSPESCFQADGLAAGTGEGGRTAGGKCVLQHSTTAPLSEKGRSPLTSTRRKSAPVVAVPSGSFADLQGPREQRPHSAPTIFSTSSSEAMERLRPPGTVPSKETVCRGSRRGTRRQTARATTYDQAVDTIVAALKFSGLEKENLSVPSPSMSDELLEALSQELGMWRFDVFKLSSASGGRPLVAVGNAAIKSDSLAIDANKVGSFLENVEARYHHNPYHNSMHGADVLNNIVYFLHLLETGSRRRLHVEPVEKLAALAAAGAHDVGHNGRSNPYHITTGTPLAMLFNDHSVLENMHSTIVFAVLQMESCNFLSELGAAQRATFRACVTHMILDTDLSKHVQTVSKFRQNFLRNVEESQDVDHGEPQKLDPGHRKELLSFALKCCDVAHSTKPFDLHVLWTLRINAEFFEQGDAERGLGLPCSPFCDRQATRVAESQRGFFDFIVLPLFGAMEEYMQSSRLQMEVRSELEKNREFWKMYDGAGFDYSDPSSNDVMLRKIFGEWGKKQRLECTVGQLKKSGSLRFGEVPSPFQLRRPSVPETEGSGASRSSAGITTPLGMGMLPALRSIRGGRSCTQTSCPPISSSACDEASTRPALTSPLPELPDQHDEDKSVEDCGQSHPRAMTDLR